MRLQATCLLALALMASAANYPRQESGTASGSTPATPATTSTTPTTSATSTPATSTTPTSTIPTTTTPTTTTTTPTEDPKTTKAADTTTTPPADTQPTPSLSVSESNGVEVTVTITNTNSLTSTSSSAAATKTSSSSDSSSSGLGTGSIVGMSVAGGLALIGIIAFFVWKFTRKRFNGFDDNEAIKWPDLNSHSGTAGLDAHPLPARDTGRAGFDTASASDGSLTRMNTDNYSTTDFASGTHDPYAVPPLPHLNPNQPYHDDPTAASGYYDPYRGPVPGTVENGSDWHGEAIPMNQIHGGAPAYDPVGYEQPAYNPATGRASPGPNAAYGSEQPYSAGRSSPGPHMAYQQGYDQQVAAGRTSPGPQVAYGGRMSPGPTAAYTQGPAPGYDYGR